MNRLQRNTFQGVALTAVLSIALLAGCDQAEQSVDSTETQAPVDQLQGDDRPLGHVAEFDDFTLRANVSPTERLPAAMAEQHGIEADPDLVMLNVVILEKRPDGRPVPVSAAVSAHYESLVGQDTVIDMRAAEADGLVSYIGTLDSSAQRVFRFVIEVQPEGTDQPLQTDFEVQLPDRP
ncbi:MAG: DUF4426 domain-containing protein [Halopseudomonas sp.]